MSQENVVVVKKAVESPQNGEINSEESTIAPQMSDNFDENHYDHGYNGSPKSNRKIFVGALNPETTEQHLIDYFSRFGEIVSCAVKICRETGHSRGFGFIVFKNDETVKKVLGIPEHIVNGKKVDPKPAKCTKDTQRKVFVGGLDPSVTPQEIEDHFNHFGTVETVETPYDNVKNRRRTYAFVVFSSEYEARKAASIEKQEISGKSCDVRVAVPREVSLRQRTMAQATQPQVTFADIQQAMWNLVYYNTLAQQPSFHNQFAGWQPAPHQHTQPPLHNHQHAQHNSAVGGHPSRSNFRASYDPQTTGRPDGVTPWYDNTASQHRPHGSVVGAAPGQQGGAQTSQSAAAAVSPYLTFPFSYPSGATATPHPLYYQTTPGYFYQPAPSTVPAAPEVPGANGAAAAAATQQQASAINDFMAAMVGANQVPYLATNAAAAAVAPSAYPSGNSAAEMGYPYRQQQQQAAFYPNVSEATAVGYFGEANGGVVAGQRPPLLYGAQQQQPNNKATRIVPKASSSSHVNGLPKSPASAVQNGHSGSNDSSVDSSSAAEHPDAVSAATNGAINLESQMASLTVGPETN